MFLKPTTGTEVKNLILSLNDKKAYGPGSIPTEVMKLIVHTLSEYISQIINISLSTGTYPNCLKNATIVPVHKKETKLELSNYRPISLLSNISKIFEKILHVSFYSFLNVNKKKNLQFGFRSKHNTNQALIQLTEKIRVVIDSNEYACGVFVDLQKAFDTVEHSILLKKLDHYGIRGIANDWFKSYLSNRSQHVKVYGVLSNELIIKHGVPQGSVLGPLLFLIYINALHEAVCHSNVLHFADDTSLLYTNKSLKKINQYVNHDLKSITEWLTANKISLNASKTELILFRSKQNAHITKHLNFRLSGQKIKPKHNVKYLSIFLDEYLHWDTHMQYLTPKISRAAGMLAKIRHYVPLDTPLNIYYAIFNSHITYGSQIWGQRNYEHLNKLITLQSKALRIINFKPPGSRVTNCTIKQKFSNYMIMLHS